MTKATLLPAKQYVQDLTNEIKKSQNRVSIMSLAISDDPSTHELFASVRRAAKRGVITNVAADSFTFSEFGGYFSPFKYRRARSVAAAKLARELKDAGVTFRWLGGGFKFNPFAGVTHIKWAIVDDAVYCFGGVNLYQEGIEWNDYMFKLHDAQLADELAREQLEITQADMSPVNYNGYRKNLPLGSVYVDNGDRGKSIIYKRACELANRASSIIFVSQYCPSGRLADILKKKNTKIYYNQPESTHFYTRLFIAFAKFKYGLNSLYIRKNYLHAKFILFEMPDGQKIALTGSHNFSYTGVNFGTREVALETSDLHIYQQLEDFFKENIA